MLFRGCSGGIMGCSRGVPGLFRALLGCSGGVPGVFRVLHTPVFVCENVKCKNDQTRNLHQKYDHATTGNLHKTINMLQREFCSRNSLFTGLLQLKHLNRQTVFSYKHTNSKNLHENISFIFSNQLPVTYNNYNSLSTTV